MLLISVTNVSGVFTTVTVTKEELCVKCFNANQAINTQVQKDDLEKEQHQQQQQQQPSV